MSRLKQIGGNLLLGLLSVGLTLLVVEVGLRWFAPPPYPVETGRFYACHDQLGWTGKPNFAGTIEGSGFEQWVEFNSLGLHDTDHSPAKPPATFRLLMLGDSYVQAVQVAEAETAHQLLEDNLNGQFETPQFEVISGGVINWGTNQQLLFYRNYGRHYHPDLVLLMFFIGNDFQDNLPGNLLTVQGFNCYAPYFAYCETGLNPTPLNYAPGVSQLADNCSTLRRIMINPMGKIYQNWRLYQQLEPLIIAHQPRQRFGRAYPTSFSALYLPNDEAELDLAWQITLATISRLQQEVTAEGHQFAVALISPGMVVRLLLLSPAERERFWRDNPDFAAAQADQPNRRLADFLNQHQIPFLDLTPGMVEHWADHAEPLYLLEDGHWTAAGNRLAANLLTNWLIESELLPGEASP